MGHDKFTLGNCGNPRSACLSLHRIKRRLGRIVQNSAILQRVSFYSDWESELLRCLFRRVPAARFRSSGFGNKKIAPLTTSAMPRTMQAIPTLVMPSPFR